MKKYFILLITFVIITGFLSYGYAETPLLSFGEGGGITKEESIKNACRNAIEQALGVLVQGEVVVKNSQLVSQEISSFTRGYIEKYEIVSEQKIDNYFTVKILAFVKAEQLFAKLKSISAIEISGEMYALNAEIELENKKSAIKILDKVFEEFYTNIFDVQISKPEFETNLDYADEVFLKVEVTRNVNKKEVDKFKKVLKYFVIPKGIPFSFINEFEGQTVINDFCFSDDILKYLGEKMRPALFLYLEFSDGDILGESGVQISLVEPVFGNPKSVVYRFVGRCSINTLKRIKKIEVKIKEIDYKKIAGGDYYLGKFSFDSYDDENFCRFWGRARGFEDFRPAVVIVFN